MFKEIKTLNASNSSFIFVQNAGEFAIRGVCVAIMIDHVFSDPSLEKLATYIATDAFHDSTLSSDLPICHPGTREAVMRDLIQWVDDDAKTQPIYYLYAPAGSGKTAIAKTLVDKFSDIEDPPERRILASFFFARTYLHRNNAERLIPTIAYQVAINLPCTARFIMDAIARDPAIVHRDLRVQMRTLVIDPLRKAWLEANQQEKRPSWPRLLVIDGLDECHEKKTQINILEVLSELANNRPFPFCIFLSCRPEVDIRATFAKEPLNRLSLKTNLTKKYHSKDDIRLYLESKFNDICIAHRNNVSFPPDWPGKETIDRLIRKSSGHFIYPSVVAKYIGASSDNPVQRLKIVCGLAESSGDENPFAQLDALYAHILDSIQPLHLQTVANVFSFALVPHPPNPREKLYFTGYLLLDDSELRIGLDSLQGILVELSQDHKNFIHFRFLHASFSDFILDDRRSGTYHIGLPEAHQNIAIYLIDRHIENSVSGASTGYKVAILTSSCSLTHLQAKKSYL
jgi:hypothetical protein